MKPAPVIRLMTSQDLDAVMAIEQINFVDTWSRQSYEFEIYGNRFSIPLVMELNGELIGYVVAWNLFEEFHIATLSIKKEFQGQGWGAYLLQYVLGMADTAEYALLEVRPSNHRAISLYKKLGFEKWGMRRRYYRNGEDAVIMRKELFPSGES